MLSNTRNSHHAVLACTPSQAMQRRARLGVRQQRGVILLFAMIVMVILFIGAAAVVKSMNTSQTTAGNLAFRRDMVNQAELVLADILQRMRPGGSLAAAVLGSSSNTSLNYSATMLSDVNDEGIPLALLDASGYDFSDYGSASNDITENTAGLDAALKAGLKGTTIRYLIERLCLEEEPHANTHCVMAAVEDSESKSGSPGAYENPSSPPPKQPVYRVNIRVSGPRDTQVFIQASLLRPTS